MSKHESGYQVLGLSDRGDRVVRSRTDPEGRLLQVLLSHQCLLEAGEQVAVRGGVSQSTCCLRVHPG